MTARKINRSWLTAARENMGGLTSQVCEHGDDVAVELEDWRQVAMFAVEVSRQAAFEAVDESMTHGDAEARVEDFVDRVVNLFDDAMFSGGRLVFHGWEFED